MKLNKKKPLKSNKSTISSYLDCINLIIANQLADTSILSPLLPPDEFSYNNQLHSVTSISDARGWYNSLIKFDHNSNKTKRKYLKGSFHNTLFCHENTHIVDWNLLGDTDIKVNISSDLFTYVKIRRVPQKVSKQILKLQLRLYSEKGNSRGNKSGDLGDMYSLGNKGSNKEFIISKNNIDIQKLIYSIGSRRKLWFKNMFPIDYDNYFSKHINLSYMKSGLSNFMVHSIELANSSHYDVNDQTITVTTWVEESLNNTDNWYLIFPNVSCDNKRAIVIQLFHGCTVIWDASLLRHASSKVSYRIRGGGRSSGLCELRKKIMIYVYYLILLLFIFS